MRSTKLFRWIWRFNAVIFAIGGLLAIAVLLFASYHIVKEVTRTRTARDVVNLESDPSMDEEWQYGNIVDICNTPYAVLPLELRQSYSLDISSGKEAASVRNILFIDMSSSARRWLLADNSALVVDYGFPNRDCLETNAGIEEFGWYEIVKTDTDNNGRLNKNDRISVALSRLDGSDFTEVVSDADAIVDDPLAHMNRVLVLYEKNGKLYVADIPANDFRAAKIQEIPAASATALQ